jgi:hypothetical protein
MKAAVLGTNDYHGVMQEVVKNALQRQAGYIAPKLTEAFDAVPGLKPYLYPIKANFDIATVWQWANGRGWICGSAALYEYNRSRDKDCYPWIYGDIDVFAHDEAAFESLKAGLQDAWEISDNDRNYKAEMVNIGKHNVGTVNVVCPPEGISWENPMNVWDDFDLNAAQCLIVAPEWVAVSGDMALVHWNFSDPDKQPFLIPKKGLKNAARFAERVQKYVQRGFRLSSDFWATAYDLAAQQSSQKGSEFESLIRFISGLNDNNLSTMRGGGMADFVAYLNDAGTVYSYDDDDSYDDGYRFS